MIKRYEVYFYIKKRIPILRNIPWIDLCLVALSSGIVLLPINKHPKITTSLLTTCVNKFTGCSHGLIHNSSKWTCLPITRAITSLGE